MASVNLPWRERLDRLGEKVPAGMRDAILAEKNSQVQEATYYQRFRMSAALVTVASLTSTILFAKQTLRLMQYGIDTSMADAGFPAAAPWLKATRADTNMLRPNVTNNTELFGIEAVSIQFVGLPDIDLMALLMPHITAQFSIAGTEGYRRLGLIDEMPAGGGIWGGGETRMRTPGLANAFHQVSGVPQNGPPAESVGLDLKEVIVWGPPGQVGINHLVTFDLTLERDRSIAVLARAADAANGIAAFSPPAAQTAFSDAPGTFLEGMVKLHGIRVANTISF